MFKNLIRYVSVLVTISSPLYLQSEDARSEQSRRYRLSTDNGSVSLVDAYEKRLWNLQLPDAAQDPPVWKLSDDAVSVAPYQNKISDSLFALEFERAKLAELVGRNHPRLKEFTRRPGMIFQHYCTVAANEKMAVLLDSLTGRTWLLYVPEKGQMQHRWMPIRGLDYNALKVLAVELYKRDCPATPVEPFKYEMSNDDVQRLRTNRRYLLTEFGKSNVLLDFFTGATWLIEPAAKSPGLNVRRRIQHAADPYDAMISELKWRQQQQPRRRLGPFEADPIQSDIFAVELCRQHPEANFLMLLFATRDSPAR